MHVLIVKMSSLGDVINTLPALTDAGKHCANISFDWIVEPAFAEVPRWHPNVKQVIPFAFRNIRKHPLQAIRSGDLQKFLTHYRAKKYDLVIDAQGLIKSAILSLLAQGKSYGYDYQSLREPLASLFYRKRFSISRHQHAITRIRQLFAQSLNYPLPTTSPDCAIANIATRSSSTITNKYCVFLHGTAREEKLWPETHWKELIHLMQNTGVTILLPWGNDIEKERAERLALKYSYVEVLPKLSLTQLANILAFSSFNVAVDTGLGHLAAAFDAPTIALYGPTKPELNGTMGKHQKHIKADDLSSISAHDVAQMIKEWLPALSCQEANLVV